MTKRTVLILMLALLTAGLSLPGAQATPEEIVLQQVFSAVAKEVGPCVVAVEIVSPEGNDNGGDKLVPPPLTGIPSRGPRPQPRRRGPNLGDGPVTGLILTQDGYIVTTNFKVGAVTKDDTINVIFADGRKLEAKKVGTDEARGLVLLKVEAHGLPVPQMVRRDDLEVGQWAIALGKGLTVTQPEIKVGVLSAKFRSGGAAIQTDAATSPTNYGGPLCDIDGRVMGVLVSITGRPQAPRPTPRPTPRPRPTPKPEPGDKPTPRDAPERPADPGDKDAEPNKPADKPADKPDEKPAPAPRPRPTPPPNAGTAGLGMYDSGIAFAIPLEDIYRQLPVMKQGKSVQPGAVGVLFETDETIDDGAVVKGVAPESPAAKAGLKQGDKIVAVNDRPITNFRNLIHYMGRYNAGDDVTMTYHRGDDAKATVTMTLLERTKLKPMPTKPSKDLEELFPDDKKDDPKKDDPKKPGPDEDDMPEVPDQDQG